MDEAQLPAMAQQIANDVLVWVGFGTLVGLLAKAIMPGRDPGGAIATVLMGVGGSVIGSGVLMYFWEGHRVTPISPIGFLVATSGAFLLLLFYRLLAGRFFREGEDLELIRPVRRRRRASRRGRSDVVYYDE